MNTSTLFEQSQLHQLLANRLTLHIELGSDNKLQITVAERIADDERQVIETFLSTISLSEHSKDYSFPAYVAETLESVAQSMMTDKPESRAPWPFEGRNENAERLMEELMSIRVDLGY